MAITKILTREQRLFLEIHQDELPFSKYRLVIKEIMKRGEYTLTRAQGLNKLCKEWQTLEKLNNKIWS
jgi:hypothetical protein